MSIRKTLTLATILVLTTLTLALTVSADAHPTRELITSFGSLETRVEQQTIEGKPLRTFVHTGVTGLAVDLETGNVYVADNNTQTVYVFGPTGGAPLDGVPSQITGVHLNLYFEPSGIAVDNSCYEHQPRLTGKACEEYDPSYGDVYIIDKGLGERGIQKFKLGSDGEYEVAGLLGGADPEREYDSGVAVDSGGNVYLVLEAGGNSTTAHIPVTEFKKTIEKVLNGGVEEFQENLEELSFPQNIVSQAGYVAVDDLGDVYVGSREENGGPSEGYMGVAKLKVDGVGGVLSEEVLTGSHSGAVYRPVAVDPATGTVYVGDGSEIAEYNSAGVLQLTFGSTEPFGGSFGEGQNGETAIAVNSETDRVYVGNPLRGDVDVFGGVVGPPVVEGPQPPVSSVARTSALVGGTANPESSKANYYFEYVAAGEYDPAAADPYSAGGRTAIEALAGGNTPQTVERVVLTGLLAGTTYHYRMVVSNSTGVAYGPDETFTTVSGMPPTVSTGGAGEVTATSATLAGVVGPRGLPTSYVFEVGTDTGYGGARLYGSAGSSTGEVPVTVGLQYLVPGVSYHYRLVATSFDGTSYGQDGSFTTPGVSSSIAQPSSEALIAGPVEVFPSVVGAITEPVGVVKHRKASKGAAGKLVGALGVCRKRDRPGRRRVVCEARARRAYGRALGNQRSKKR
jgi:hypothetical protein